MCLKEVKDETPLEQTHVAPDPWSLRKGEVKGSMAVAYIPYGTWRIVQLPETM